MNESIKQLELFPTDASTPMPAQTQGDPFDKLRKAVRLVRSINMTRNYTIAFSGGKDSTLLAYICREAGLHLPMVYNLTTIDPKGTTDFCRRQGAQVLLPSVRFLTLVERKGLPTMWRRFCCSELKEKYISPYLLVGVRRDESVKRKLRYCSFEIVRRYNKDTYTVQHLPLLNFTNFDVETIINERQIECHPLYYDQNGRFCVKRRLGCLGCPLQSDRGRADYRAYPRLFSSVIRHLVRFHVNHGRSPYDAYINAVHNLFYSNGGHSKFNQTYRGFFERDPKQFLESQFNISL